MKPVIILVANIDNIPNAVVKHKYQEIPVK